MLPKSSRLTVRDIQALSLGKSAFTALVSIRYAKSEMLKFGVSVSKKGAPRAVDRNRIRRRTYSLLRKMRPEVKETVFVLVMPKKDFLSLPFPSAEKELRSALERAHLI